MIEQINFWENAHKNKLLAHITGSQARDEFECLSIFDKLKSNLNVLVIGVGTGDNCKYLFENKINVDALDISDTALENVKEYCENIYNDSDDLPKNKYDIIVSFLTIQHIPYNQLYKQCKNVLESLNKNGIYTFQFITLSEIHVTTDIENIRGGSFSHTKEEMISLLSPCKLIWESPVYKTGVPYITSNVLHIKRDE